MREHIARDMTELIGATPLLEAARFFPRERGGRLLAKLEYLNPAGSVKDRAALSMIDDAERRGKLAPAASSSSPPPATRASAWRPSPRPGTTGWCSPCPTP